ncbi:MAG: RHS repeat-associated core domain-containing protein [Phycisphaerae bacterium]
MSYDADGNLAQVRSYGDANCDGAVNNFDVDAFVLAVADAEEYETEYPTCDILNCDMNGDGLVNNFDLDPFVGVLTAPGIGPVVLMNFAWDAENRLVAVWPATPLVASVSKKWLYDYDYLGRRVRMRRVTLIDDDPVTWGTTADIDRRFVYDGWLLLEELDGLSSNAILRQYTWGLDLAGMNGSINDRTSAGGIGGLLGMYDTQGTTTGENPTADDKSYYYCYDANGNVGQVIDLAGTGAGGATLVIAVQYEYDPYGNRINIPGGGELDQPFRFSTKYFDVHTAMYYYGRRYYFPGLGRWGNRDPIQEFDDPALYRSCANAITTRYDTLGLESDVPNARIPVIALDGPLAIGPFGKYNSNPDCCDRCTVEFFARPVLGIANYDNPADQSFVHYSALVYRRGCCAGRHEPHDRLGHLLTWGPRVLLERGIGRTHLGPTDSPISPSDRSLGALDVPCCIANCLIANRQRTYNTRYIATGPNATSAIEDVLHDCGMSIGFHLTDGRTPTGGGIDPGSSDADSENYLKHCMGYSN